MTIRKLAKQVELSDVFLPARKGMKTLKIACFSIYSSLAGTIGISTRGMNIGNY
jgi:hypothetical protein